jgi:L-fucose mutarotase
LLIGLNPLLTPDLLQILRAMGHGDEIAIVDANFPAETKAKRVVRLDGVSATDSLDAVLSVLPLDSFVGCPAHVMAVVGHPEEIPPAVRDFQEIVDRRAGFPDVLGRVERFAFYERVTRCFAAVATGERRLYGNIILTKGVVGADGKVVR